MKNKLMLSFLFSLSLTTGLAQPLIIGWQNCFGGPGDEKAYGLVSTGDGYMLLATAFAENQGKNLQLLRTDTEGNLIWEKHLGGTGTEEAVDVNIAGGGNYFVSSFSTSSDGDITYDPYPGTNNYWVVKVNGTGDIIWDRICGGNCLDLGNNATNTSDGGVVAYGYSCSKDGDVTKNYGNVDAWMIKLDSAGNKAWDFSIGHNNADFSNAVYETSDRGILASAQSYNATGGNIECEYFNWDVDIVLFKLDSTSGQEWQQCYGGSRGENVYDIIETSDGYILAGGAQSGDGDLTGSGYHLGYDGSHQTWDIWLLKIDFTGNIVWSRCYGGTHNENACRIFETPDGGFIVFGDTYSFDGDVTGNHSVAHGWSAIWVIKVNRDGDLLWQQCFGGNGDEKSYPGDVVDNGDGNYVVAATLLGSNSGQLTCQPVFEDSQVWLFQLTDTTVVSVRDITPEANALRVYPNPANEYVMFEVNKPSLTSWGGSLPNPNGAASPAGTPSLPLITITDIIGRPVARIPVTGEKTVWDARGVMPGVYLYQLQTGKGSPCGKLMIAL